LKLIELQQVAIWNPFHIFETNRGIGVAIWDGGKCICRCYSSI